VVTARPTTRHRFTNRSWRGWIASILALGLVAAGASAPAFAASPTVQGFAFRDFNSNGVYDTGNAAGSGNPNDLPLPGVIVTAYGAAGTAVGSGVTDSNGDYSLSLSSADASVRVEFTFSAAQQAEGYQSSFHGADNGSSVQFVAANSTGVDFAANVPEDYIQSDPDVAIAAHRYGDNNTVTGNAKDLSSVVSLAYEQNGDSPSTLDIEADYRNTGSLYGLAFQKGTTNLFSSAVLRAHTGLGDGGLGGIYLVDTAAHTSSLWLDLSTTSVDVGQSSFDSQLASYPGTTENEKRGLTSDPTLPNRDPVAVDNVGTIGLGGLTISSDQKTLYAVNLYNRTLVVIDIQTKAVSEVSLGTLSGDDRPFGVAVHRGVVYVGMVDSATSTGARSDLAVRVVTSPEATLAAATWTTALDVPSFDFARGPSSTGPAADLSGDIATHWNAWTNDWSAAEAKPFFSSTWITNPQPILSTMTFDASGNLVLGFLDRFSYQSGMLQYAPTGSSTDIYSGIAAGGMYGASPDGDGTYTFEDNGVLGGVTGGDANSGKGPGGGRYYDGTSGPHSNALTGAVAAAPGFSTILSTGYDLSGAWTSEAGWIPTSGTHFSLSQRVLRNSLGDNDGGNDPNNDTTAGFGKAGGLGGVTVLAELAPVEIGNRVWFDADQNGVQDADEPAIGGVTVDLYDSTGTTLIGTTTTDSAGEYYFDVNPDTTYVVKFVKPTTGNWSNATFGDIPWSELTFTDQAVGPNRAIDSNADTDGNATVVVGGPGQNDHTIDAGLVANAQFTVEKLIDSAGGTPATGQQFTIGFAALDFRGNEYGVSPNSVTISADQTSSAITVPLGTKVKLTETADASVNTVSYGGATPDSNGYFTVSDATTPLALTVTNLLFEPGRFSVTKVVTGDFSLADLAGTTFTINYTYPGGQGSFELNSGNDFGATSDDIPYNAEVTISESISGAPANVEWGTPIWSTGDNGDGTATVTIGNDTTTDLTLTNPSTELTGTFAVTKSVTGDGESRLPSDFEFTVEYSLNGGTTWTSMSVKNDETVNGPASIPTGTVVQIREVVPTTPVDINWGTPAFSGTGVTPGSPATFTIGDDTTVNVLLENPTTPANGQFSVLKDVTGPGEPLLDPETTFTVNYTYEGGSGSFELTNGESASSPLLPVGTVVTITEVSPTGGLPSGATWGTPTLTIDGTPAANGATLVIGEDTTVAVTVLNPTDVTPTVTILKGDGTGTTIDHEADTVTDGQVYQPGETRTIVIRVQNTGPEPLRNVELTDDTISGAAITALTWTFPDSSTTAGVFDATTGTWSANWGATFDPGTTEWAVGAWIYGSATLTVNAADDPHQDSATVNAVGAYSGKSVTDDNPYNAFTGAIQVIKYDGEKADPIVQVDGAWVTPTKPLPDTAQDANTTETAVSYPVDKPQKVRWVVTNTGTTWLTNISLADVTDAGPKIGNDWTADLTAFGGPANYSFVNSGPWQGLFPPGASFFAQGTLTLPASSDHADTVTVIGTIVVPATNPETGAPTDQPLVTDGVPVQARDNQGNPLTLTDNDPFHAKTPAAATPVTPALASTGGPFSEIGTVGGIGILLLLGGAALGLYHWRKRRIARH